MENALVADACRIGVEPAMLLDEGDGPVGFLKSCGGLGGCGHYLDRHGCLLK
jgi:hypothetical protein